MSFFKSIIFGLAASLLVSGATPAAEPSRTDIITGMRSAQAMKSDVRHVMELAEQIKTYEELVEPNIDIFLIGVDTELPIRLDILVDPEHGQRSLLAVPIADLQNFITNNLNPIDIIARRDRNDRNLYSLSGSVIESGWMRIVRGANTYAVISALKEKIDVPPSLEDPQQAIQPLVEAGYGTFAHLENPPEGIQQRLEAFDVYRNNVVDAVQKTPQESREAFELRKAVIATQMDYLGRLFAESAVMTLGSNIDQKEDLLWGELLFGAIADTSLASLINQLEERPSYFASLEPAENSVMTLRIDYPIDETLQQELRRLYELARPVAAQRIDEDKMLTDEERAARKKVADLLLDVLDVSADMKLINGYVNVAPVGDSHNIVLGVRFKGQEEMSQLIDLIPQAKKEWSLKRDVAEEHGVAIHEVSMGQDIPAALKEFFGASGLVYLGIGPDAFWAAGGEGALDRLKAAIAQVKEKPDVEPDGTLLALDMETLPILETLHQLSESGDLDFLKELRPQQVLPGATGPRPAAQDRQKSEEVPVRSNASAHRSFQWQQTAIDALKTPGFDSTVQFAIQRTKPGTLTGKGSAQNGLLRALGAVIGKFADENLR